jgi:hypothetical protein
VIGSAVDRTLLSESQQQKSSSGTARFECPRLIGHVADQVAYQRLAANNHKALLCDDRASSSARSATLPARALTSPDPKRKLLRKDNRPCRTELTCSAATMVSLVGKKRTFA